MIDEPDLSPESATVAPPVERIWALVANLGEDVEHEKFAPGAKVFVHSTPDAGARSVTVVGRHRGSRRWVIVELPVSKLGNWRVKQVHKPGLLERLADGDVAGDEAVARSWCGRLATDDADM